jgi:hypothetical protein
MTREEADSKIKLHFMQLDLMRTYEDDLKQRFGKRGYEERIDGILDNLILCFKVQRKYKL